MWRTKTHTVYYCPVCKVQRTWPSKDGIDYKYNSCKFHLYYSYKYNKLIQKQLQK